MLQLLVHAGHHSDVVVVDEVDFLEVEQLWKTPSLVREEEISNGLRLER